MAEQSGLRFQWSEILTVEITPPTGYGFSPPSDQLSPESGESLLESLDESAHKHAYGVSEDLKYAVREAIEIIGNEAVKQLKQQAQDAKTGFYSGTDPED